LAIRAWPRLRNANSLEQRGGEEGLPVGAGCELGYVFGVFLSGSFAALRMTKAV
jgi:hypothetical protein